MHGGGENRRSTAIKRMAGQKDIWRSQQAEARSKCPLTRPSKGFFVSDNLLPSFVNSFLIQSFSCHIMPFQSSHIVFRSNRKLESIALCELQAVETWEEVLRQVRTPRWSTMNDEYPALYGIGHRPRLLGSRQHAATK